MTYLSVCSGIEAVSVAWKDLGWKTVGFSEIEPFPCAVLAHHYPDVINYGDINGHSEWEIPSIDILVGGTPCQSFSIAGLRKGLADPRGNIMLTYLRIIASRRPRWIVWENVPGVLSSNKGRDFGTFLGALGNLGYGFAYRILDAQWFGVAQRRKRVFVVGCLGDSISAAKVLFESESVSRNPAPSREKGQGSSTNVADCPRSGGSGGVPSSRGEHLVATRMVGFGEYANDGTASTLKMRDYKDATDLIAMAFHPTQTPISSENISHALGTGNKRGTATVAVAFEPGIAAREGSQSRFIHDIIPPLRRDMGDNQTAVAFKETSDCLSTAVRRLTPTECERLQGFPDGYTAIKWKNKPSSECPDGPRYKALGNSMAVPVMKWIGERINKVNKEQQ